MNFEKPTNAKTASLDPAAAFQDSTVKYIKDSEKMADLEASNLILKKYKAIYQAAHSITCSTCNKSMKPVIFKGHLD